MAYFFLLRRSEIVSCEGSFKWFCLKSKDITLLATDKSAASSYCQATAVAIQLAGSKTNQLGAPTVRLLQKSGHPFLCPVFAAGQLLAAHGSLPSDTPACRFQLPDGKAGDITANEVTQVIRDAATRSGSNSRHYGTHSLRAGGATSMYKAGIDQLTIQFHGRWQSEAFKTYTRLCEESTAKIASKMIGGSQQDTTLQSLASASRSHF